MATYATPADVAESLRGSTSTTEAEQVQWQKWLDSVESQIVRRFKRLGLVLADRVALGDPTAADVAIVEVDAVIRRIQNPDGMTSTTVSVDDGSITKRRDGYRGGDPLTLTDDEWDRLLPTPDRSAWSTRPAFEPDLPRWPL